MIKRTWAWLLVLSILAMMPVASAMAAETRVARCNVILRKQADTSSDSICQINGGTEIEVLGTSGAWTKTKFNGHTGYVYTKYLMEMTRSGYYPLKEGDENPYVKELQKRLVELGYLTGSADGKFGASTSDAVKAFQKANRMTQDGVAGGETQKTMFSDKAVAASGSVATGTATTGAGTATTGAGSAPTTGMTASGTTLKMGSQGEDVKTLQARLIELGYLSGKADGVFGAATQKAVVEFQKRSSLTADGKAGKVTQNLLFSTGAKNADGTVAATAPTTGAADAYKTLKRGMTSNDVKSMQQQLKDLGYFASNTTGYYGSVTQLAVEKFQKANNLTADGVAGPATLAALYSSNVKLNGSTSTDAAAKTYATLKEGMKSTAVTTMQKKLKTLGYLSANATGYFGSETKKAVVAFQRANSLTPDGVAGSATLNRLYGDTAVSSTAGSSGSSGTAVEGSGKITGPSVSSIKLLHWFNSVKPSLSSSSVVQIYDPASGYGWKLKTLSLGRHFDSEPLTAEDTLYMNAAFGGSTTWTPKPVYVKLSSGTWTLATMHNVPHLSGSIQNNNFDGHLCVHFLRDMDECTKNDPNYGVQHQKAIRDAWKKMTGQTVN